MLAQKTEAPALSEAQHRVKFFRQSGWLMFASVGSGALMWAVHFLSKRIPDAEYRVFGALMTAIMCVPAVPLQMVFAQQVAADLATHRERQLSGKIRLGWICSLLVWVILAMGVWLGRDYIMARWTLPSQGPMWVAVAAVLGSIWMPMSLGLLQGKQDFLWLGWGTIFNGVFRLGVAAALVLTFSGNSVGMLTGVVAGLGMATAVGIWRSRELWTVSPEPSEWHGLSRQVVPLLLGFGASQFVFTSDTMFVNAYFPALTAPYIAAGTLSRALVWVVGPLTSVMFPKIVHSTAKAEKMNLLGLTLLCTGALTGCGVLGLWLLGPWLVKLVWKADWVTAAMAILPWYAAAMVPLALANVLINDLLARSRFRIVPILVVLAVTYGITLTYVHGSMVTVLQVLGVFNVLVLAFCAWFTWRRI